MAKLHFAKLKIQVWTNFYFYSYVKCPVAHRPMRPTLVRTPHYSQPTAYTQTPDSPYPSNPKTPAYPTSHTPAPTSSPRSSDSYVCNTKQ